MTVLPLLRFVRLRLWGETLNTLLRYISAPIALRLVTAYLPSGEVGKADIHYWQSCVRHTVSLRLTDDILEPSYILRQSNFDETPVTIWRDGKV